MPAWFLIFPYFFLILFENFQADSSDETLKALTAFYDECQADPKVHVDPKVVDDVVDGRPFDSDIFGKLPLCTTMKENLLTRDGEINKGRLEQYLGALISDKGKLEKVMAECTLPQKTIQDTAIHIFVCLHQALPPHENTKK